jgi:hypothetical protein
MRNKDRWEAMFLQIVGYLHIYKRRPSKYFTEDLRMVNWLKYNRKLAARGAMPPERMEKYNYLVTLCEKYQRINQNAYVHPDPHKEEKE